MPGLLGKMRTAPAPFTLSINAPKPSWNFLQQVLTDARVALFILRFVRSVNHCFVPSSSMTHR